MTIALVAPEWECTIVGWSDGLTMAVGNLLRNALLHGQPSRGAPTITVTVALDASEATIVVDDNGPGIAADDRERVLRRFERGTNSQGLGLGLALVDQIARLHHGSLHLGEAPGGGARCTLSLRVGGR